MQKSLHELTEKNRIYNELEAKHSRQTAQMLQMLARCEKSEPAERRRLLKKVLLLGTYIKRSANLYFLSSEYQWLPQQELRLTVDEAVRTLTACGTECGVIYRTTGPMRTSGNRRGAHGRRSALAVYLHFRQRDGSVGGVRRRSVGGCLTGGDGAAGGRLVAGPHRDKGA